MISVVYVLTPADPMHLVDDWNYNPSKLSDGFLGAVKSVSSGSIGIVQSLSAESAAFGGDIGFSVGGSKDINNFRENIKNDFLPLPTDITYEGLYYDYYFDTGETARCSELFCPSYSYAISQDPFSQEDDYYLSVGLNSGIEDFQRKKLNVVVVLDISGSMGSPFNKYYYDQFGNRQEIEGWEDSTKTKMELASQSVVSLLDHLEEDDRFAMVLFNNGAQVAKPLNLVGETDMNAIKSHILKISANGGTNMEAGYKEATDLFNQLTESDPEYENRIIFLTDAMPNMGITDERGLLGMTQSNSRNKVYTTFIGIGLDFHTGLIEHITKIKGANYYSVHSASEFKERMDEQFEYMVTPLVFDLELILDTHGYKIEKVYGSPEANEATGEIMKVNTLFPSAKVDGETKGGIVLLKLRKISDNGELKLTVSYEDREGITHTNEAEIELRNMESDSTEHFANDGIRKGILLSRYADLMKNWIMDARGNAWSPTVDHDDGIVVPEDMDDYVALGKWERQSTELHVSEDYQELFREFKVYFQDEMDAIGDNTLDKELDVLQKLAN
jgi:Ca-activated chloride channel homolog